MSDTGTLMAGNRKADTAKTFGVISAIPAYLYLLPIAVVVLVYGWNANRISIPLLADALLTVSIAGVALAVILRLLFRNAAVTDIVLGCLFIGLFTGNYFASGYHIPWLAVWVVLAAVSVFHAASRSSLAFLMNCVAVSALALGAYNAATKFTIWQKQDANFQLLENGSDLPVPAAVMERDIYYIVLDRYARADQLLEIYGYDNTPFINALKEKGFLVADKSYSNYQRTAHSLASSLNLSYLATPAAREAVPNNDWLPVYDLIANSKIADFLTRNGFDFHFFGSWWEPTRRNANADFEVNLRAWPELLRVMYENSLLGHVADQFEIGAVNPRQLQCRRAKHKFSQLQQLAAGGAGKNPKFVFAHFLVPHPPFVIDRSGQCLDVETVSKKTREDNYVEQVRYANRQLLAFLDAIDQAPGPKPVVILQADEGPWPKRYVRDEIRYLGRDVTDVDWLSVSPAELREKMGILNAVYLPERSGIDFPPEASPVNNFRLILREYFGLDIGLLENRAYVFPDNNHIKTYHAVGEKLQTR